MGDEARNLLADQVTAIHVLTGSFGIPQDAGPAYSAPEEVGKDPGVDLSQRPLAPTSPPHWSPATNPSAPNAPHGTGLDISGGYIEDPIHGLGFDTNGLASAGAGHHLGFAGGYHFAPQHHLYAHPASANTDATAAANAANANAATVAAAAAALPHHMFDLHAQRHGPMTDSPPTELELMNEMNGLKAPAKNAGSPTPAHSDIAVEQQQAGGGGVAAHAARDPYQLTVEEVQHLSRAEAAADKPRKKYSITGNGRIFWTQDEHDRFLQALTMVRTTRSP
jgi:hypothetical protein